ncbi:phage recombination protein Bet [Pediococcus acidilactici NGRI 0510Q]|uniref:Phage recombination protein Bet n=1 Tax=Pediococcus acidilactici TaxID=1254 RepID=A0AAW8YEQ5_PEDAC|nr:phage recombination protein Bet [Pediococcus acidilactici]GAC44539.1 phage recombination protein Bet [Pediococcus acidilactici NGRI 0510Q]KRN91887.1 phage recombination protein Bet [Pediococcus acidilactici]MDV2620288.1 phage recombination protein Bet [Pediococcus acidilactici]QIO85292.1 phage recombination protein Bet [Pediococcus acidilactici]QJW86791.1 phage recombination protein Bet [Pediococcus acidilactici]
MSNELMNKTVTYAVNGEDVNLSGNMVKSYLTSGNGAVTDQEVTMFIQLCRYQHLNPFLNEAYLVKFGNNPAQIITSKEAFMKRAEANENYDGMKAGCIVERDGDIKYTNGAFILKADKILGAWAEVYRKDRSQPVHIEISMEEFSKSQATWKSMPATMIRKTAIVNALREAFPQDLGALYTEDDKNPHENKVEDKPKQPVVNATEVADTLAKKFAKQEDIKPAEGVIETNEEESNNASNHGETTEPVNDVEEPTATAEVEQGKLL